MTSLYQLTNIDLALLNCASKDFQIYLAFLNPIAITTSWADINMDSQGNWQPPGNVDCAARKIAPYAPVANLGSNRIGFVGEPLYFDGLRSWQRFDLPVVSYNWTVTGGPTTTYYHNNSQVGYTWSSPGIYTVKLTVKDRAGTAQSSTRQIMIYANRAQALPGMVTLSGPSASLENGGWQCQITTVNSQFTLFPPDALPIGTYQPLVILAETRFEVVPGEWVNHTVGPYGQFNPGSVYQDPRILFDGYVQTGSVHQDIDKDTLSFTCIGLQLVLNDAKTHMAGYYNCAYTSVHNGIPQGCKTSPMGKGFQVGGLMTNDILVSILQFHSTISQFHDIHLWNSLIPCAPFIKATQNAYYNPTYSTLSVNEGSVWQNLQDLANNEWAQVYCEHDGSLRVGPQINYRGEEYWSKPWLFTNTDATAGVFLNLVADLGFTVSAPANGDTTLLPGSLPTLPAQPMPITFVHEWGPTTVPGGYLQPFQPHPEPLFIVAAQNQQGPPLLLTFSDTPIYDPAPTPPVGPILYAPIAFNWPQDLALYPISIDIQENYTGRTALVKLIGTLANSQSILTAWFPVSTFSVTGDGTSTIVETTLPAGNWDIDESHVIPDVTAKLNRSLVLNWWWEMAHRLYYAQNANYQATVNTDLLTCISLGDIVGITRQNAVLPPSWNNKPFFVDGINYQIDLNNKVWQTSLTLNEVTSSTIGPIQKPPKVIPKW